MRSRLLRESEVFRKEMMEKLKMDLAEDRKEALDRLDSFRRDFRKKERGVRRDLEEASRNWKGMRETLQRRKKKKV